ncbi:MAG: VOC family protein [Ktedonobacteraceae bacterium]|nr:VOC family protein [Ktedonobacteraceae bacterium]
MSSHSIVHVEIPAQDASAASKFYADLFDWKIVVDPTFNYHMFQPDPGPGGGFVELNDEMGYQADRVLIYVSTDDIDASLAKVEELGGKTVKSKTEIPGTGWFAIFTDPTGNTIALFTNMER